MNFDTYLGNVSSTLYGFVTILGTERFGRSAQTWRTIMPVRTGMPTRNHVWSQTTSSSLQPVWSPGSTAFSGCEMLAAILIRKKTDHSS